MQEDAALRCLTRGRSKGGQTGRGGSRLPSPLSPIWIDSPQLPRVRVGAPALLQEPDSNTAQLTNAHR